MRQEVVKLNKILDEYKFLCEKQIDSPQELVSFISETREQISVLEKERQSVYNRNRHKKSEELNAQAREISTKIKTMRKELSTAKAIFEKIPRFEKLLETERQMENAVAIRCKERRRKGRRKRLNTGLHRSRLISNKLTKNIRGSPKRASFFIFISFDYFVKTFYCFF